MNLRSKLISLFILAVILLFVWLMIQNKSKKSYLYPDFGIDVPENYQSLGIDVSHYQGEINWAEVSAMTILDDSIGFAFIKLTEGTSLVDDQAMRNAEGATEEEILLDSIIFSDRRSMQKVRRFFSATSQKSLTIP
ncbi:MAG: hypothetical protein IPG07_01670 [Crocinitomicaceae bacterium]|nr:hypothetical protein [Crocinitomicaceae bacterium]